MRANTERAIQATASDSLKVYPASSARVTATARAHRSPPLLLGSAICVVAMMSAGLAMWPASIAGAATTVSPETYMTAVCGAIATLHSNTLASETSVQKTTQAFISQPTPSTATQLRQALVVFLQRFRGLLAANLAAVKSAGVPAGKNGVRFAKALSANLQAVIAAVPSLVRQANKIDVTSSTRFYATFQQVAARVAAISNDSKKQARKDPAFQHVSAALHPIVAYVTSDVSTCPAT